MKTRLLAALTLMAASNGAVASVILLDAERNVEAFYDYVGAPAHSFDNAKHAVTQLGALDHIAEVLTPGGSPRVHSRGQQDTDISPNSVAGSGSTFVDASVGPGNIATATSLSRLSLTFSVSAPVDYSLDYELAAILDTAADALALGASSIELIGPAGVVHAAELSNFVGAVTGSITGSQVGTLQPGEYTLTAEASQVLDVPAPNFLGSGESSFELALTLVPEPATAALLAAALAAGASRRRGNQRRNR